MEQNEINIEKRELVKRIKDDYHSKLNLNKWLCGFDLSVFVVELVWKLINGTIIEDLTTLLVIMLLTAIILINYIYIKSVEPIEDAKELLHLYDKATYKGIIAILIFAAIQAIRLALEHNYFLIVKAAIAIAIAFLFGLIFSGFQNKEIDRLRKLVKQEDEKNEASVLQNDALAR